jgi:peptide/nickel transport system permease protein
MAESYLHDEFPEASQGGADPNVVDPEPVTGNPTSPSQDRKTVKAEQRRELFKTPSFIIGAVILLFWVLCAVAPGVFTKWGENEVIRLEDGSTIPRTGPGADSWFGTDTIGNDVFARVIYGADNVLINAPIAALIAVLAGAVLGLMMGFYRGWVDEILSRIIEAILSLPVILLAIMVLVVFGSSRPAIVLTIAGLFTPVVARTVRSAVMTEAQLDYVTSAKLRGESGWFIMMREIFPNITNVLIVEFTVRVGYAIFTVATLAFLGLSGGDQTAADWGVDISNGYSLIQSGQWWVSIFPAIAIASLVIAVNLIADSIEKVYKA